MMNEELVLGAPGGGTGPGRGWMLMKLLKHGGNSVVSFHCHGLQINQRNKLIKLDE